jgi:hypothetical protein
MTEDIHARLAKRMAEMKAFSDAIDASQIAAFEPRHVAMWTRHKAVGYFQAAEQIIADQGTQEPKYFLYSHAIELALKAFLLVNGHTERECVKFGHDIAGALRAAQAHGLELSEWHNGIVESLSREHNRPFSFRYFNKLGWAAPGFDRVSECCRTVIGQVQGAIFAANELALSPEHLALIR